MPKIYNTLTKRKDTLNAKGGTMRMFVCGPTVYDYAHIGHARTYIAFDAFVKYLRYRQQDVFYLQNITDIDDKIIIRAQRENTTQEELAKRFEEMYYEDTKKLGIDSVTKYARTTDHVQEVINQVQGLMDKGYAYQVDDGVYFDITKFEEYGKLSGRTSEAREDAVTRIDESVKKRNPGDFAVWKLSKKNEPSWDSPFGKGRPGWHIEDTAITEKFLGETYDLHGGARDLLFPHHEAEVALMESLSEKKPLAKYWMHTGFLNVGNDKMSKSLGNFITIREFLKRYTARELRAFVLKAHYRSPISFNEDHLLQSKRELERLDELTDRLKATKDSGQLRGSGDATTMISVFQKGMISSLDDDFNTPKAFSVMFEMAKKANNLMDNEMISAKQATQLLDLLEEMDGFLLFIFWGKQEIKIPNNIEQLAQKREEHRKNKEWDEADKLRQEVEKKGWKLEDTDSGYKLSK